MRGFTSRSHILRWVIELDGRWSKPVTVYAFASAKNYGVLADVNDVQEDELNRVANDLAAGFYLIAGAYKDELTQKKKRDIFPPVPKEHMPVDCLEVTLSPADDELPRGKNRKRGLITLSGKFFFIAKTGVKIDEFFSES